MNSGLTLTLVSGAAVIVTALCLGLWQILSAPDRPNFPTSGPVKRALMFWFMVALAYRGLEIGYRALQPDPVYSTEGQLVSSLLMAALFVTFLIDHLRHWLPARTHRNIQRLRQLATCRPARGLIAARTSAMKSSTGAPCPSADVVSPALLELALQGVSVTGPGEGPKAITGAE